MTDHTASQHEGIGQVAESFVARFRAGERPSIEEYVNRYPELAGELRKLLPALVMLEQHGSIGGDGFASSARLRPAPREIGEFTIVREIGRGGMGVVYEAIQQSLGRHVALKVLSSPSLLNPTHLERFRLEARSAGRLHHSHIVPVFGVGEHQGMHYYAMQFIPGQSLDQVIEALRRLRPGHADDETSPPVNDELAQSIVGGLLSGQAARECPADQNGDGAGDSPATLAFESIRPTPDHAAAGRNVTGHFSSGSSGRPFYESVARVGLQVAEALAYAHSEGILHRDIKPSNLILDAKGNTWVTDFGLVKAEDTQSLTETGDFVGTLRYMAPERLDGWSDRRSDIYGLGATLYELLTLRTFFENAHRGQLLDSIRRQHPQRPSKVDPAIPRDLETIVLKALSKEPGSRYRTADEMAEDLRRFLADRPILARRSTARERFVRWCRRNPLVASLAAATVVLTIVALSVLSVSNVRIARQAQVARTEAVRSEQVARFLKDMLKAAGPTVHLGRDTKVLREILDRTAERVERDLSGQPEVQGDLWFTLGVTYLDIGEDVSAVRSFEHAVDSYRQSLGGDNEKVALSLANLGRSQAFVGMLPEGQHNAEMGVQIARACGNSEALATCLLQRAKTFNGGGKTHPDGAPAAREALSLWRNLNDPLATAECMAWLAGCVDSLDESESLLRESLAIYRQHISADDPRTFGTNLVLGQILVQNHQCAEAESILRETRDQFRRIHDRSHPYQTIVSHCLAQSLALQEKWAEAEEVIREIAEITPRDTFYITVLVGMDAAREDWAAAIDELTQACKAEPWRLFEMTVVLLKCGHEEEYLERCHEFLQRAGGPRAAMTALLRPVSGRDFDRACELAEQATEKTDSLDAWSYPAAALADYRRSRFEGAIEWAQRAKVKESVDSHPQSKAAACFIEAMAHAALTEMVPARTALAEGDNLASRPRGDPRDNFGTWDYADIRWQDWAIVDLLRAEAAKLVSAEQVDR